MILDLIERPTTSPTNWATSTDDTLTRRHVTAGEVISAVLERNNSRDVAALTAIAIEYLPSDYGGIRRALQELVAGEIRRQVEGRPTILPRVVASAAEDDSPPSDEPASVEFVEWQAPRRERSQAGRSQKWQDTAAVANDPLQARVLVAGVWRSWATLTAEDLRDMARAANARGHDLIARSMTLDQLAADMDAAGVSRLASLPDAAARIEAIGC